jgi:hypothetical protein
MSNKILEITEKVPQTAMLPDGNYAGTWGGYNIDVQYKNKTYQMKTKKGVKGIGIKVVVNITNGVATFNELKN